MPTSSLFSSPVGLCKAYILLCCHPADLTACIWTWCCNDPRCYSSEEILSEKWKLEESWGDVQSREEVFWLQIASLTGPVNKLLFATVINVCISHEDNLKNDGAFLWGGKVSIFYHVICKYRSVSINVSNSYLHGNLLQVQILLKIWH